MKAPGRSGRATFTLVNKPTVTRFEDLVVEASGAKPNKVFMPIRLAVTGKKISPPIDYTLALLPKDVAMERIRRVLET